MLELQQQACLAAFASADDGHDSRPCLEVTRLDSVRDHSKPKPQFTTDRGLLKRECRCASCHTTFSASGGMGGGEVIGRSLFSLGVRFRLTSSLCLPPSAISRPERPLAVLSRFLRAFNLCATPVEIYFRTQSTQGIDNQPHRWRARFGDPL